ncbi:MAG: hypothetical protein OXE85_14270 [Roseovarius sp.]|nr:hypothetical protein [Roseovarius sp.]
MAANAHFRAAIEIRQVNFDDESAWVSICRIAPITVLGDTL